MNTHDATFITEEEFASAMAGRTWLVSHGGCASEALFEKLGLSYPAMTVHGRRLRDVVSHLPRPMAGPETCIYLYGSPIEAILSQMRRHHYYNPRKIHNKLNYRNMHTLHDVLSTYNYDPFGINSQFIAFCCDFADYPIILQKFTALSDQFSFLARYLGLNGVATWQQTPRTTKPDLTSDLYHQLVSLYGRTADIMEQMPAIVMRLPVWNTGFKYDLGREDLIELKDLLHLRQYARIYVDKFSTSPVADSQIRIKHAIEYKNSDGHDIFILNVRHDIVSQGFGSVGSILFINHTLSLLFKITHPDIMEGKVSSGAEDPRYFRRRGHWCVLFNALCHDGTRRMFLYLDETKFCIKLQVPGLNLQKSEKNWTPLVIGDEVYFIYSLNPTVVLQLIDDESGRCHVVDTNLRHGSTINPIYPYGGSALQLWAWPYFIGLAHTRNPYRSVFYVFDAQDMKLVAVGKPFDLPEPSQAVKTRGLDVQYPYHLEIDNGRCQIWVECQDHCPTKYEFKFESLCEVASSLIATRIYHAAPLYTTDGRI